MIAVNIYPFAGGVHPYWSPEETALTLSTCPSGVTMVFTSEMDGEQVEMTFHPALVKMLQGFIDAQPANTFMAKEGKSEIIAEMEEFDKEWDEKQRRVASKRERIEPPF